MILSKDDILLLLQGKKPISIIRAGDGEGIVLNCLKDIQALELCSHAVLNRQLGYSPSINDIKEIRLNLINAYNGCDIIGIPCHRQATNSHWGKVLEILDTNVPNHSTKYCDIDIAYHFLDNDSYELLLRNRKVLNYISCRDLDEGFKRKYNIEVVNKYTISPESKFTSGYKGPNHYPELFNKVPRWMDVIRKDWPGSLLLVGAGVIGKIYCNWWRDRGGIAFDVGACMDCWAGKVTRGPERGLDKEDLTFKL